MAAIMTITATPPTTMPWKKASPMIRKDNRITLRLLKKKPKNKKKKEMKRKKKSLYNRKVSPKITIK